MSTLCLPVVPLDGRLCAPPAFKLKKTSQSRLVLKDNMTSVPGSLVATHTRSIGIIHPPPEMRKIIDKTAQFVAKNGPDFVRKIMSRSGAGMANFNFLHASDPYHAYYQHRLYEFLHKPCELETSEVGAAVPSTVKQEATEEASKSYPYSSGITPVFEPQEVEQYTLRFPEGVILAEEELDIIKVTAQFVARGGHSFLTQLVSREINNPKFNFLKPTHSMYTCFIGLVEVYSKVLTPPEGLQEKLKRSVADVSTVLERCLNRLECEQSLQQDRKKAEEEMEKERMQMAMIDWHDFVVVDTIEFEDDDEDETLPQPVTLEDVTRRRKPESFERDTDVEQAKMHLSQVGVESVGLDEICDEKKRKRKVEASEEPEPPMRIVTNWKRPEERIPAERYATEFVVSPITGELIPINEMTEHIRISLIDPKHMEQKERMMVKIRGTSLAQDDEISRNIVKLSQSRPDIFGTTQDEILSAVKAEIGKKQQKEFITDGDTGTNSTTANQDMSVNIYGHEKEPSFPPPDAPPMNSTSMIPSIVQSSVPLPPRLSMVTLFPPQPLPPCPVQMKTGQQSFVVHQPPPTPLPLSMNLPTVPIPPPPPPPPKASHYTPLGDSLSFASMPTLPPPLPQGKPLPSPDEPKAKRQRVDDSTLISLDQFLRQHQGPSQIFVSIPCVAEGNSNRQTIGITVQSLSETVGSVKDRIAGETQFPANKQKLSVGTTFLKDDMPLAYYNIGSGGTIMLGLKERGGRKK